MKKTNKENPITTFRKANEARQGAVMKSLKKAQAGIQTNGNPEDMMINKPGSTGGYKKPMSTESDAYRQKLVNERYNSAVKESKDTLRNAYNNAIQKNTNRQKTDVIDEMYPNYQIAPKKKGGSVKKKK